MKTNLKSSIGLAALAVAALVLGACKSATAPEVKLIESHSAKDLEIFLMSEKGELSRGQNRFFLEFRSANDKKPADVGSVTFSSSMAMPGMAPMTAPIELEPAGGAGRYAVKGDFAMSGAWRFEVRWDGPAGQGSTTFNSNVR